MSIDETISEIIDKEKSLIRIGDGDMYLFSKRNIAYQSANEDLLIDLKSIILDFKSINIYSIAINPAFKGNFSKSSSEYWYKHFYQNRKYYFDYFRQSGQTYSKASIFWPTEVINNLEELDEKYKILKSIWKNKHIVVIEGEYTRNGVGNDLFKEVASIRRVLGPSKDAYGKINEIFEFCQTLHNVELYLISLGPSAKPLAMKLININKRVIDLGHFDSFYEKFLNKSEKLIPSSIKHTAGLTDSSDYSELVELNDPKYLNQILKKII